MKYVALVPYVRLQSHILLSLLLSNHKYLVWVLVQGFLVFEFGKWDFEGVKFGLVKLFMNELCILNFIDLVDILLSIKHLNSQ